MIREFLQDEGGATSIEYCLLAVLIALVLIGAVDSLGTALDGHFNGVADTVK